MTAHNDFNKNQLTVTESRNAPRIKQNYTTEKAPNGEFDSRSPNLARFVGATRHDQRRRRSASSVKCLQRSDW